MQRRTVVGLGTRVRRGLSAPRTRLVTAMSRRRPSSTKARRSHANAIREQTTPKTQTPTAAATMSSDVVVEDAVASEEGKAALLATVTGATATSSIWDTVRMPATSRRAAIPIEMSFVIGRAVLVTDVACVSGISTMAGQLYQPGNIISCHPRRCRCTRQPGTCPAGGADTVQDDDDLRDLVH